MPGSFAGVEVFDSIVSAIGQVAESRVVHERVIIGGDYEGGEATVSHAIASGRQGAGHILERIGIPTKNESSESPEVKRGSGKGRIIGYDLIKPSYFKKALSVRGGKLDPGERVKGFLEVAGIPREEELKLEADRCISCGNCTACGYCWYFCPDACVVLIGGKPNEIIFETEFCKGCALCSTSCPRGCIVMKREE